jgi:NAD(P)-dependent dehydrogenase (short-subunit alcohol dehydrogenase family)
VGRVVAITGAARGLGRALVEEFLAAGQRVAAIDIGGAAATELPSSPDVLPLDCDVTDSQAVEETVATIVRHWDALDVWVNNAGVSHMGIPIESLDDHRWRQSVGVMQDGVFYCMRAAGTAMLERDGGAIVNVASVRSFAPKNGGLAYCAPKAAVVMMTEIAASEWGSRGIRVNAVAPGGMRTPMWDEAVRTGQLDADEYIQAVPARRLADPQEIARLVRFLASDTASYINGATVLIDGGMSAFRPI